MHDFGNHNVGKGAAKSGGVNMCKFYSTTEMGWLRNRWHLIRVGFCAFC